MLQKISDLFETTLYIQIWTNRIKAVDIKYQKTFDEKALLAVSKDAKNRLKIIAFGDNVRSIPRTDGVDMIMPFQHPRTLCSDFCSAEALLLQVVRSLCRRHILSPRPSIIIHPMEKLEGGLTPVENRAFRELALGAGAKRAAIYVGPELSPLNIDFDKILRNQSQ